MIPLGFEIGSGRSISVPLGHTVVIGQTSRAGKTTALEAMAVRSERRILAFSTKRGEQAFLAVQPNVIPPYYEEQVDWRTIRSLCEALTEERWDKFQRQCLRSACRAGQAGRGKSFVEWVEPRTLAEVRANVHLALSKATGQRELVFGEIQDDLDTAIEEIAKLSAEARKPDLKDATINLCDLVPYEFHVQQMILRSFLRWVHRKGSGIVAMLPEAWKFTPAQRRTPVRDAAEELVREGAALENFLWIDSQNISAVSGILLSQIRLWLFGVQRLRSEIEKTLAAIPDNIDPRPTAAQIATLGIGQFIACFDREMYRVYVQPARLAAAHAEAVARGEEPVESVQQILREAEEERTE